MRKVFLPGCKVCARFKPQSDKLKAYLEQKEGVQTVGCCKAFCSQAAPADTAVVICNNCAAIMEESSAVRQIEFVWNIIDNDPDFPFPDYHGERIIVQDCWRAHEKRYVQDAVRSLMRKMNIVPVELPNNYEKADFCGADLLEPCTDVEKSLLRRDMQLTVRICISRFRRKMRMIGSAAIAVTLRKIRLYAIVWPVWTELRAAARQENICLNCCFPRAKE